MVLCCNKVSVFNLDDFKKIDSVMAAWVTGLVDSSIFLLYVQVTPRVMSFSEGYFEDVLCL